jgi:hypothetical protein
MTFRGWPAEAVTFHAGLATCRSAAPGSTTDAAEVGAREADEAR